MAHAKYVSGGATAQTAMGEVKEETWTTIAADRDGEPLPDEIGARKTTRHVHFAFRAECEDWLSEQTADGWKLSKRVCNGFCLGGVTVYGTLEEAQWAGE